MTLLNTIPLIGALFALLLGVLILFRNNQNIQARITLGILVILNIHNLLESYFYYNDYNWSWLGISYLHYHLTGALFLLYTYCLFRIKVNLKFWIGLLIGFTLIRLVLLSFVEEDILESANTFSPDVIGLTIDGFLSVIINLYFLILTYLKIKNLQFAVDLNPAERISYSWLKSLLIISIFLFGLIFINNIFSLFDNEWLIYFKVESVLTSIFSLSLVYATMRFPIFSLHGDFKDLSESKRDKYLKSSVTEKIADQIWEDIQRLMDEQKPYLNAEYRLNDLAASIDKSIHHVSQVINEKQGTSFSDFINQYRITKAQKLLRSGRTKQVTILAVAYESGFNSKTAFYNTFKRVTGKTPSDYIKEVKKS